MRHRSDPQSRAGSAKLTRHYIIALLVFIFGFTSATARAGSDFAAPAAKIWIATSQRFRLCSLLSQWSFAHGHLPARRGKSSVRLGRRRKCYARMVQIHRPFHFRHDVYASLHWARAILLGERVKSRVFFEHHQEDSSALELWFSIRADFSSLEQTLFSPTTLSSAASAPATFENLAAAFTGGRFTNPQLASILISAPLVESPYGPCCMASGCSHPECRRASLIRPHPAFPSLSSRELTGARTFQAMILWAAARFCSPRLHRARQV